MLETLVVYALLARSRKWSKTTRNQWAMGDTEENLNARLWIKDGLFDVFSQTLCLPLPFIASQSGAGLIHLLTHLLWSRSVIESVLQVV